MDILNVHLDNSLGTTQCRYSTLHRPPLDIGGCLWNTASFSWHVPQGAGPRFPSSPHLLCPWKCQAPLGWTMFYVPSLPKSSPDPWAKSFKSEISVFIMKQEWEPEHQKWRMWEGKAWLASRVWNHSLPITSNPCKIWRNHLRVCFGSVRETPKPWFLERLQTFSRWAVFPFIRCSKSLYLVERAGHTHSPLPPSRSPYKTSHSGFSLVILAWTFKRILE